MDNNPVYAISSTFSNSSSESDETANAEYYRTKVQDLMKVLQHYHKVVKHEQTRNESLQSLNESMKDTRQNSGELQLYIQRQDGIIAVLQNRLAQLGASTEISLSPDESIVLPSQANFENLIHENRKLKENLKYTSFDPNGYEVLQQQLRTIQNKLYQTQTKHKQLHEEYEQYKNSFKLSSDEKNVQIYTLREKLHESERNTDVHSTLCQSLTDETLELRDQLQAMIMRCQKFERVLANRPLEKSQHQTLGSALPHTLPNLKMDTDHASDQSEKLKLLEKENNELKAELHARKQELDKVLAHNANWQTYESQRESHVVSLQQSVTELGDKLAKARAAQDTGFSDTQQQEVDKIVLQYKGKLEENDKRRQSVEDENRELRRERLQLQRSRDQAEIDSRELRQTLQALTDQAEDGNNYRERAAILEEQLKIFNEDFQTERRDREQAVSKISDLESELYQYKQYYERQQRHQTDDVAQRRQDALHRYEREYFLQQQQVQFLATQRFNAPYRSDHRIGIQSDGPESPQDVGEDVIDMPLQVRDAPVRAAGAASNMRHANTTGNLYTAPQSEPRAGITKPQSMGHYESQPITSPDSKTRNPFDDSRSEILLGRHSPGRDAFSPGFMHRTEPSRGAEIADSDNDTLQCPKCQMAFKATEHLDLLDHINDCCM